MKWALCEKTCRLKHYVCSVTWKDINREVLWFIYTHLTLSSSHEREREREREREEERYITVEYLLLLFFIILLFWRSFHGFLLYGFPSENICVLCIFYILCILLYLLFFQIEIIHNIIISKEKLTKCTCTMSRSMIPESLVWQGKSTWQTDNNIEFYL